MTKLSNKWLVATALATAALAAPQIARAHGEEPEKQKAEGSAEGSVKLGGGAEGHAAADHPAEAEHEEAEEEGKLALGIDMVVGFGKTPVVTQQLPGSLATVPEAVLDASRVMTESFLIGGSYEIGKGIAVGARLPFAFGTFSPPARQTRSTTALGSLELEGEYELHLNEKMKMFFALGVSLPTAQGDEVPSQEELDKLSGQIIDQNNFDRFSVNKAAASSRGYEENALFEPKRLGFIPKVGLDYKVSKVLIQPYVKVENLISTVSGAEHSYLGELVFGAFLGYEVHKYFDAGVRVWGNVAFAGGGDSVGVLEPQIRGHVGSLQPLIGAVIPFAGGLTDPQFGGLRLALAARF